MIVDVLHTTGKRDLFRYQHELPSIENNPDLVLVKTMYTSICRSDVDMWKGNWGPLPAGMFGHESIGTIVDSNDSNLIGQIVATAGDGAFSEYHVVSKSRIQRIDSSDPKYILEPVACAINIAESIESCSNIIIIGSGFVSTSLILQLIQYKNTTITLVSNYEQPLLNGTNVNICNEQEFKNNKNLLSQAQCVVILKNDQSIHEYIIQECNPNTLIIQAAELKNVIHTTFQHYLWKNLTLKFPSPRTNNFKSCMERAYLLVKDNESKFNDMFDQNAFDGRDLSSVSNAFKLANTAYNKRLIIQW